MEHDDVENRGRQLLLRIAVLGSAFALGRTRRRADILALMAKAAGALSDIKTAGFAEIVSPGIAGGAADYLVQRFVTRSAIPEFLRVNQGRKFLQRKPDLRISRAVCAAALLSKA